MPFSLKALFSQGKEKVEQAADRFKNRPFMEACMAGCAMIAAADGSVDAEEMAQTGKFIEGYPALKNFDNAECVRVFQEYCSQYGFGASLGNQACLKALKKITDADQAETLVYMCIEVGGSDGDFDDDEVAATKLVCSALNQNPANFSL